MMACPKKNSSMVWKYFQKDPNNPSIAVCSLCKNTYKRAIHPIYWTI